MSNNYKYSFSLITIKGTLKLMFYLIRDSKKIYIFFFIDRTAGFSKLHLEMQVHNILSKKCSSSVHTTYKITTLHLFWCDFRIAKYKQPLTTQLKKSHLISLPQENLIKTILKADNMIPGWMVAKQIPKHNIIYKLLLTAMYTRSFFICMSLYKESVQCQ